MTELTLVSDPIAARIDQIRAKLGPVLSTHPNQRLQEKWQAWDGRLGRIRTELQHPPEVAISLVGGTGAGKSTFLNAVLNTRLLPVSSMRACTAAVCEVSYHDGYHFTAEILFVSRQDWQREIDLLLADISDAVGSHEGEEGPTGDGTAAFGISKAAADKLWAVYKPTDETSRSEFDPWNLIEPPEITRALDSGRVTIKSADFEEFRKQVAIFLDSKHRFWPIVRTVRIKGPFQALKGGIKLIDLPGINDPNEAREAVTRSHLKTSRYVWIVFNIKRALTGEIVKLMKSGDFLRQIVMDGRTDSLTFIGTAADDVDPESGREEFGLADDAADSEVIQARNQAVRLEVANQLDDLSIDLARISGESAERGEALAGQFKQSKIFTVSAREHLRLAGIVHSRFSGLDSDDQTEIPAVQAFLHALAQAHGIPAQQAAHHLQLDLLLAEIKHDVQSLQTRLSNQAETTRTQRKEVEEAADRAQGFLSSSLVTLNQRFVQDLAHGEDKLRIKLDHAFDTARNEITLVTQRWASIHWSSLRATVRRGGLYKGANGDYDFAADLTKPILDGITFAWSDYFGEHLGNLLKQRTENLIQLADYHRANVLTAITQIAGPQTQLEQTWATLFAMTEKAIALLVSQTRQEMDQRIEHVRRHLYENIPGQIRANMLPAFALAAEATGSGLKQRIVTTLERHAHQVSGDMFDDAQQKLQEGVSSLADWLARMFADMGETVRRHAGTAVANLGLADGDTQDLDDELHALGQLAAHLEALTR